MPSVRKIKNPNKNRKIMIGASHHFFLSDRKSQNSFKIDNLDKFFPLLIKTVSHNLDSIHILYFEYSNKTHYFFDFKFKKSFPINLVKIPMVVIIKKIKRLKLL